MKQIKRMDIILFVAVMIISIFGLIMVYSSSYIWAEYKFDEDSVKALINWAKSTSFPQSVTLSDAENIVDVKRFVQANLSDIDAHYPDDFYNPAITRLYRLKEYMEENK